MKRNTHLPKSAYLSDEAVVENIRAELADKLEERAPGATPTFDFFFDKRTEEFGVEVYLGEDVYNIVTAPTLLEAIDEATGDAEREDMAANPPSWVADEETWDRAKQQVAPYWEEYDDPWAVVTTVYEQMGGEIR